MPTTRDRRSAARGQGRGRDRAIRRAALAADRAFEALTAETWIGRSERELAWRLRQLLHAHGIDHLAFDTAIAAGLNGSKPHAEPSDDLVEPRTLVDRRLGRAVDGYCSDCTRTLATGELSKELRRIYDVCLEAQLAAVAGIKPGMTGVEADRLARDVIEAAGYGDNFGHGLGHGVGLADPRGAAPLDRVDRRPRGRERGHDRAGDLPARTRRRADRGPRGRPRETASSC